MKRRSTVHAQENRLRTTLQRALLVALAAPATMFVAQACSSTSSDGASGAADGSLTDGGDSGSDDGSSGDLDGGPCAPKKVLVDAKAPDGGVECGVFQQFSCGLPQPIITDGGSSDAGLTVFDDCYFLLNDCPSVCPGSLFFNCHIYGNSCDAGIVSDPTASMIVECASCPNGVGRRPRGLDQPRSRRSNATALGKYFANAAHLEAASVHAFRILRRELASFGAPDDLLVAAKRAEVDEVRHTKLTAKIARAHGSKPPRVRVARGARRSLEAIALENAVEGCVRETFGALVAMWQAERATDDDVAAAMKEIAVDETRHAALAWSVAAWADTRLDTRARERIEAAKNKAISDLENELAIEAHPDLVARAGLPSASDQRRLLSALFDSGVGLAGADFET